ncbi:MAG TPA: LysR family transcriptional regulator [Steroidobacteraceae bacterium]|nr:LysR family transcriptional regulator [Steroidobacteraceae bacterium]
MQRDLLSHLPVVRAVAECGGFAAAAARLGMSPSAVSHAVKIVEEQLGLPLFARTTRSVSLTEAGSSFLAAIGPALTAIEEAGDRVRATKGAVTGLLRLNIARAPGIADGADADHGGDGPPASRSEDRAHDR